jgi:putative intracellular protease/amidase
VFIKAVTKSGVPLLSNAVVASFSNIEEDQAGLTSIMPYMLEDELNRVTGGGYVKTDQPWGEKVVVSKTRDGATLITGQNPAVRRVLEGRFWRLWESDIYHYYPFLSCNIEGSMALTVTSDISCLE